MYCDADMEDSSLEYLGPPRRQIYDLLTSLIEVSMDFWTSAILHVFALGWKIF